MEPKAGATKKVGTTTTDSKEKSFQSSGVEGTKGADDEKPEGTEGDTSPPEDSGDGEGEGAEVKDLDLDQEGRELEEETEFEPPEEQPTEEQLRGFAEFLSPELRAKLRRIIEDIDGPAPYRVHPPEKETGNEVSSFEKEGATSIITIRHGKAMRVWTKDGKELGEEDAGE